MKSIAIVTSFHAHFEHVVRIMQPMNKNCKFIHVYNARCSRRDFDMAIEYCRELWQDELKKDIDEIQERLIRCKAEVKCISDIQKPFTLYFH